mgnify:CR=1 FL=1
MVKSMETHPITAPERSIPDQTPLDPAAQPRPAAQQRLVGHLDGGFAGGGVPVEGQQPGMAETVDYPSVRDTTAIVGDTSNAVFLLKESDK